MLNSRPALTIAAMLIVVNAFIGSASAEIETAPPAQPKVAIQWRTDIREALWEAIERKRPVVIFFTHTHEGDYHANGKPCFAAKTARDIASSRFDLDGDEAIFIVVEVGSKATADGKTVAKMFEVDAVPRIRVLAPAGGKLHETYRINGYFPLTDLLAYIRKGLADANYKIFQEQKKVRDAAQTTNET